MFQTPFMKKMKIIGINRAFNRKMYVSMIPISYTAPK
jgi:hypothetical protein